MLIQILQILGIGRNWLKMFSTSNNGQLLFQNVGSRCKIFKNSRVVRDYQRTVQKSYNELGCSKVLKTCFRGLGRLQLTKNCFKILLFPKIHCRLRRQLVADFEECPSDDSSKSRTRSHALRVHLFSRVGDYSKSVRAVILQSQKLFLISEKRLSLLIPLLLHILPLRLSFSYCIML